MRAHSSVEIRPARRSVITPVSVNGAEVPSCGDVLPGQGFPRCPPPPARPVRWGYAKGSYPKSPKWPGPLPGEMPTPIMCMRPTLPSRAKRSMLGVEAASNSVGPPTSRDNPPRPSITSNTILVSPFCVRPSHNAEIGHALAIASPQSCLSPRTIRKLQGKEKMKGTSTPPGSLGTSIRLSGSL